MSNQITPRNKSQIALSNERHIYNILNDSGSKLPVTEIYTRLALAGNQLSDKTIRRALTKLKEGAFVQEYGKQNGAVMYGVSDLPGEKFREDRATINFGGTLVPLEDFVRMLSSFENDPFKLDFKSTVLSETQSLALRRRMLAVVITAGVPGYNEKLHGLAESLIKLQGELEYITKVIKSFTDSPVWYEQYRDGLAYQLRRLQEKDPDLYKIALDLVKGE